MGNLYTYGSFLALIIANKWNDYACSYRLLLFVPFWLTKVMWIQEKSGSSNNIFVIYASKR